MKLWIVGIHRDKGQWEFVGVFDDEAKAVSACTAPFYFVAPAILNQVLPEETLEWDGCYYPISTT